MMPHTQRFRRSTKISRQKSRRVRLALASRSAYLKLSRHMRPLIGSLNNQYERKISGLMATRGQQFIR